MIDHTHELGKDVSAAFLISVQVDSSMAQSVIVAAPERDAGPVAAPSSHLLRPAVPVIVWIPPAATAQFDCRSIPTHRRSPAPRRQQCAAQIELPTHSAPALGAGRALGCSSSAVAPQSRVDVRDPRSAPELSFPWLHPTTSRGCRDAHKPTDVPHARRACRPNQKGGTRLE